jgi:hypothetical protein
MLAHEDTIVISWEAPEFVYTKNTPDWFWGIGILTIAGSIASFLLHNALFGILILIGGVLLMIFSRKKPENLQVDLSEIGIRIGDEFLPYEKINAFSIHVDKHEHYKIFLRTKKEGNVDTIAPIANDIDPGQVREFLLNYIQEEELQENIFQQLMERLGY